ncbi:hypothetical protein QJQ45_010201 [Haematococcus lacustris]|nr:hypothetical protein QJQ45_010201 [Haematococcus lacustris]
MKGKKRKGADEPKQPKPKVPKPKPKGKPDTMGWVGPVSPQGRLNSKRWNDNIKLELQHLAAATSAGTSLVAIQRHVAVTLATWDAVWGEYLHPKWAEQKMRLYGAKEKVLERYFKLEKEAAIESQKRWGPAKSWWCSLATLALAPGPCEEGLDLSKPARPESWKPKPGQVQNELLRSAWSKRFEAPVRGLMWCPQLHQATPGNLGKWVDRDCNAAHNLHRAGESKWRSLELCRWPHRARLPANGKEYLALGFKKLRDSPQGPGPAACSTGVCVP